jgi:hypothetical protein
VQQVAGDYLTYTTEEELDSKVSTVVRNLLPMLEVDTSGMDKLAVLPVQLGGGSLQDANTLAQILSVELMRNKMYAIYPRTASLEQVLQEVDTQRSGVTDEQEAAQLGRADNPRLALSVAARRLGSADRFNASIINLEDGLQTRGASQEYANMRDGITAMGMIARMLSGQEVSKAEQRRRAADLTSTANREESARRRAEASAAFNQKAAVTFAFNFAVAFISEDQIGKRIFGEPASDFDDVPKESKENPDGTKTDITDPSKAPLRVGIPLDFQVGFQYSWFSINSGATFGLGFHGPSQMEYSFVQVPVILRGDWTLGPTVGGVNLFAGIGFNWPLSATVKLADESGVKTKYDITTMIMPPTFILGAGFGADIAYLDLRFNVDMGEVQAKAKGRSGIGRFSRFSIDLLLGLRFKLRFSKS